MGICIVIAIAIGAAWALPHGTRRWELLLAQRSA